MEFRTVLLAVGLAQIATAVPVVRYTTYLGGANVDISRQIVLSAAGEIYVIGSTVSTNFPQVQSPVSMGPAPRRTCLISAALSYDCSTATGFVAKLTSGASSVGYAAYYGGDGAITAIAVDASGSAYLVGMFVPSSSTPVFTPTPGAYDTTPRQGPAPFLVKLTPDGNSIVYATYLDGPPAGVAVDGFGNAIVAGTVARAGSGNDAYVLRLNPSGSTRLSIAYVGGSKDETATGLTIGPDGRVVLLGQTSSPDLPLAGGVSSGSASFVARLNLAGTGVSDAALLASGSTATAITNDAAGNVYLVGTSSGHAFAAKLNAADLTQAYLTKVGGTGAESGDAIAVDAAGRVYITGTTTSLDFPVTVDAFQRAPGGGTNRLVDGLSGGPLFLAAADAYVVQLNAAGSIAYASYLGGSGDDRGYGIAIDSANNVYVTGSTRSGDLRYTSGAFQPARATGTCDALVSVQNQPRPFDQFYPCDDVFVTKIDFASGAAPAPQVTNGASFTSLPLAPGTLVSVFGQGMGPAAAAQQTPGSDGRFGTSLAGSSVTFDGVAAPILYAQDKQLNVVVPYGISIGTTSVKVQYNGVTQDAGSWAVASQGPSIFTLAPAGQGQGAILNEDGSVNSPTNPAARGSVIAIYATGAGATNLAPLDGAVTAAPYPSIVGSVNVWFSSIHNTPLKRAYSSGQVTYSGAAPSLIAGAVQVNVVIPSDADVGPASPVFLEIGNVPSQVNVTVAVK